MKKLLSNLIFPHYCCSCEDIGEIFCDSCVYDIASEGAQVIQADGSYISKIWYIERYDGVIKTLVCLSKYDSCRDGCDAQAKLFDSALPHFPNNVCVVAVPTIRAHIRQRGYGHSERVASAFARRRRLSYAQVLQRRHSYVQQGSNRAERIKQAKQSFYCDISLKNKNFLLIDDVYTTGSTVKYAAKALKDAGAQTVYVAVIARQGLD